MFFIIFFRPGTAKQGEARNASVIMERNSKLDKADQVAVIEEKLSYLLLALENYAKALIKSDKHDLKMYRWISLWFANTGKSFSKALILASTSPQYAKRLFIELQVQYVKIASSEHAQNMYCTKIVLNVKTK